MKQDVFVNCRVPCTLQLTKTSGSKRFIFLMIAMCVARKRFLLFSNYIYTILFSYTGTVAASKQAVNAMASNSSCVFTGQADRKVKIWRVNLWSIYPATLCVLTTITIAYIPVAFIQCTYFHSPWCLSCSPHYWLIPVLCTDTMGGWVCNINDPLIWWHCTCTQYIRICTYIALQENYYPDSVVQSFHCMRATWFQYFNDMSDSSVQWANETRNTETTVYIALSCLYVGMVYTYTVHTCIHTYTSYIIIYKL